MTAIIQWLRTHPFINWVILLVYYLAVVLPHVLFGAFLNNVVFQGITRRQYNLYVLIIAGVFLLGYVISFIKNTQSRHNSRMLYLYMLFNIANAVLIINILFVINIEIIHFPQYAIAAVLLFPLTKNYNASLLCAVLLGVIDEGYQYFVLAPELTYYYDFNDVVTNLVGAVFGLLLLRSLGLANERKFSAFHVPVLILVGAITVLLFMLSKYNILSIYPSDVHSYHIMRVWPPDFWSHIIPEVTYHVIRPLEGLVITILLLLSYSKIGSDSRTISKPKN